MVSVIIPNYNHSHYLVERIDSVLNQTYQDFEVIILDDFSTDASKEIIELYRNHPKVSSVVYNAENSGSVFKQWRKGIMLAKGEFIWIAESDDLADIHFLEKLLPVLQSNRDTSFVYSDCRIILPDGTLDPLTWSDKRNAFFQTNKWSQSYIINGHREIDENLLRMCTVNNTSATIFRKDALLKISPFDIEFRLVGDWYCFIKLCMFYDMAYVNEVLSSYRDHHNNSSKNLHYDSLHIAEYSKLFGWMLKNIKFIPASRIKKIFLLYTLNSSLKALSQINLKIYKEAFRENPGLITFLIFRNICFAVTSRFNRYFKINIK